MRVLGVLLVVAACGAKAPAESLDNLQQQPPPRPRNDVVRGVAAPRPAIDISWALPEFHEELRWPLSGMNHPSLEPQFPVAQELAVGIDWQQLCARGVHQRISATQKELLSYLRGWCDVAKRDVDAACANLTPLLGSVKSGLRPAVRQDLANILVEQGDADKAEHWLSKHRIRDVQILDLLAANYIEVGSEADAFTINRRAMDSDDHANDATKCRRLVKRIVIGLDHDSAIHVQTLKDMVLKPKVPDATCERLWNKIACWSDRGKCAGYVADEGLPESSLLLAIAYDDWPAETTFRSEWWSYADQTRQAIPAPGAVELVVSALEAGVRADINCAGAMVAAFTRTIATVRLAPNGPAYEERLQKLEQTCAKAPVAPPAALPAADILPTVKVRPVAEWPASPQP